MNNRNHHSSQYTQSNFEIEFQYRSLLKRPQAESH